MFVITYMMMFDKCLFYDVLAYLKYVIL